ncbi:hypothetical protein [Acidiphilium sp. C61]|jgi:hypothetical protein|uniref:hypothetical protein n=1 Tax=Acidiphilium sp. C61 TaxID=1671485 RepID=UPI00157A93CE|nr:hypothetical protein [Acidiphilium sp. C61]
MSVGIVEQENTEKRSIDNETTRAVLKALDSIERGFVVEFGANAILPFPLPRIMRRPEKAVLRKRCEAIVKGSEAISDFEQYVKDTERLMLAARNSSNTTETDATFVRPYKVVAMLVNVLAPRTGEGMLGDLDEEFVRRESVDGIEAARRWYRRQTTIVLLSLLCRFVVRGDDLLRAFDHLWRTVSSLF